MPQTCFDRSVSAPAAHGPGRPRDPDVERRALSAARSVYGRRGWSGFTLDEVARVSGIGKGSLYLRWPSKAALLVAAVRAAAPTIGEIDTGELFTDLVEFGRRWMRFVSGDDGSLMTRLGLDRRFFPELAKAFDAEPYPEYIRETRAIVRRGVTRGELPRDTSPAVVADLVAGAIGNHVRVTPEHLINQTSVEEYVTRVVTTVLDGVRGPRS